MSSTLYVTKGGMRMALSPYKRNEPVKVSKRVSGRLGNVSPLRWERPGRLVQMYAEEWKPQY